MATGAQASRADCWPKGTKTLKQSDHARVYSVDHGDERLTYGCLYSTGRRVQLDEYIDGEPYKDSEPPYRLAGRYVAQKAAYVPFEAYQGWEYGVDVIDLRTGRAHRSARDAWNDGQPYDPEVPPDPKFSAFILTSSGNAAWIASYGERQLWRLDSRGPKWLDQARQLTSLRVAGSRVHWENQGSPRAASFR